MIKKRKHNAKAITTLVSEHCHINGTVHTQQSIQIDGYFEGEINAQGEIFVGEKSKVVGNLFGKKIHIAGEVIGSIEAIQGLYIGKTGKVYGDISGDELVIEEGAIYKGKVNMDIISSKSSLQSQLKVVNTYTLQSS